LLTHKKPQMPQKNPQKPTKKPTKTHKSQNPQKPTKMPDPQILSKILWVADPSPRLHLTFSPLFSNLTSGDDRGQRVVNLT